MEKGKTIAIITLILVFLLGGLHYAFAAVYRDKLGDNDSTRQWVAFIVTATTIELTLCGILLGNIFKPFFNRKIHAFLIALVLMLEFAIAVVIATLTSQLSILIDTYQNSAFFNYNGWLDTLYHIGIADSVISFVLKFILLLVVLWMALDNLGNYGIGGAPSGPAHSSQPQPVVVQQGPPLSANRLN